MLTWFAALPLREAPFVALAIMAIVYGVSIRPSKRVAGCLFGLISQPYWLWIALRADSSAAVVITAAYTLAWIHGAWKNYRELMA